MKLFLSSFLLLLLSACITSGNDNIKADAGPLLPADQDEKSGGNKAPSYVPGEVLVSFSEGTSQARINAILKELDLQIKKSLGKGNLWLLETANNMPVEEMVEKLEKYEEVEHASPNWHRFKFRPRVDGTD